MQRVSIAGLLKMVLPDHTIRWCDGAFFNYDSELYRDHDDLFGVIGGVDTLEEGLGDTVPALTMTVLPPAASAAADISQAGNQTSRVTFMLAEYDYDTGEVQAVDVQFNGQLDQSLFTIGKGKRQLNLTVVSLAERLFEGNLGNTMNATFHKSLFPGETGHDQATGLTVPVAWGTDNPSGTYGAGSGGMGGGSGGAYDSAYGQMRQN